ncbi:hypothetical protein ACNKHV_04900 [Shigella flexneri]
MTIRRDLNNHSAPSFARRLYCSGTAQCQPLPVKRSKIRLVKKNAGRQNWLRRWASSNIDPSFLTVAPPRRGLLKRLIMKSLLPPFVIR